MIPLDDGERERNLETLRFIVDETARAGSISSLALGPTPFSGRTARVPTIESKGLTPETHAPYCRDALALLLKALSRHPGTDAAVHGESGIPEGNYDFWKNAVRGIARAGRRVEIDMHAKGIDQKMIDIALATGMPVNISPKYWAEHMGMPYHQAGIRELEMPPPRARTTGSSR